MGTPVLVVDPSPSWPSPFQPQHTAVPERLIPQTEPAFSESMALPSGVNPLTATGS